MVYVTHDQVEAMTLGARIAVLENGRLQQYSAALDIYRHPANLFVARFVGTPAINTVAGEATIAGGCARFACDGLALAGNAAPEAGYRGPCTLAVRPEGLQLAAAATRDEPAGFTGQVLRLEPLGNEILVHVAAPASTTWIARVPPDRHVSPGDVVSVSIDPSRAHLFDANGERLPALPA